MEKSLQELSKEAHQWTLHSDRELHLYLKSYSGSLIGRIKSLEDSVRQLSTQADRSNVRLRNTLNQFLSLSDSQFIENRVYDEEQDEFSFDTSVKPIEQPLTTEKEPESSQMKTPPGEESIASKYRKALEMGMEAMKLFAIYDENEMLEPNFDTVLDIYNERPLPFIIGSREFLEDDTLGLGAAPEVARSSSSSSFGDDSSSEYSASDSASGSFSDDSDEIEEVANERKKQNVVRDSEDGLFGQDLVPADHNDGGFSDEEIPLEYDSDNESGLFGKTLPIQPPDEKSRRISSSSSDSETSGLFGSSRHTPPTPQTQPTLNIAQAVAIAANSRVVPKSPVRSLSSSYSDADSEEKSSSEKSAIPIMKETPITQTAPFLPPEPRNSRNEIRHPGPRKISSYSSDEDGGLFGSSSYRNSNSQVAGEKTTTEPMAYKSSLFDDDSDNESTSSGLFGSSSRSNPVIPLSQPQVPIIPSALNVTKPRIDNSSSEEGSDSGLFSTKIPAKAPRDAISDSDSDDWSDDGQGLFGTAPPSTGESPAAPPTQPKSVAPSKQTQAKREIDSDSDDWDDDGSLFGTSGRK